MPHVASDFNAIHASGHHAGARPRAARAEAREATSPFSELVDAKAADPAPPPSGERRSDQAPVKADDAAPVKDSAADTTPKAPADKARAGDETAEAAPPADGSETKDSADAAVAAQLALATAGATGAEADTDVAESEETKADDKTAETDSPDIPDATLTADTTVPPVVTEPKASELTVAPVAPPVAAPVEAPTADQAEPAADDTGAAPAGAAAARTGSAAPLKGDDDGAVQGAGKSRGRKTGIAGAKHADDSQPAKKAAATHDAEAEPEQAAASKGDGEEVGNDNTDVSVQPHKVERAHAHASAGQHESQKSDTPAGQVLVTDVSTAVQGARPPAEALHTVLQANDRVSGATVAAQAPASDAQAVPLAGLAVEIAARAQAGHSRFEIRLDPPELGRIDVRLDVDTDGNVTSRLVVDRVETLDVLRRDAHTLERALQDAGLKTSDNSLQFSLRDQGFAGRDGSDQRQGSARLVVPDPDLAPVETRASGYGRLFGSSGGIDIRV